MFRKILLFLFLGFLFFNCTKKDGFAAGMAKKNENCSVENISWLGNSVIRISGDKVIYFDPARLLNKNIKKKADIIFISHGHSDHFTNESLKKVIKKDTLVVTVKSCADLIKPKIKVKIVKPGDIFSLGNDIKVEVVPAYETGNISAHTKKMGFAGYIVSLNQKRYYFAGITGVIPEMKKIKNIDVAFLPISGGALMKSEVIQAFNIINPKILIPVHYSGFKFEVEFFKQKLKDRFVYLKELNY